MAARRTHRGPARLILGCCFLQLCGAPKVPCTVTLDAKWTTYSVPEVKANGCEFSWTNASDAHHQVLGNQENFTSSECFPRIDYQRSCISESMQFTSSCLTNCSGMEVTVGSHSWIAAISIPVILVLMLLVGFLYKYRIKVLKWIRAYTPVEKVDQEAPDEAEKTTSL